jgi:hypothetical protein
MPDNGQTDHIGGAARSYQELFVPFAVLTALAGHVVSPYIYAASGLARTSGSAGAGACCPEPERTAALPDSVSCNGVVAPEDGLRFGERLSELPGQAPMFLAARRPGRRVPAGTVNS